MSRIGCCVVLMMACTQAQLPAAGDDVIAPDGGDASDGGAGDGGGDDGGDPQPGELAIHPLPTTFHDERGDRITFPNSVPLHDHVGGTLELGGSDCPELFKYAYLLDPQAPLFGGETAPNPLRWLLQTAGAGDVDYRVRRDGGPTVLDWAPLAPESGDTYAVTLLRSGPRGIAELGTTAAKYFVDVRIHDATREAVATVCFQHHPLAAPVQFTAMTAATVGDAVQFWTFAANSPVSHLMNFFTQPNVYQAHVVHATAEPVVVRLAVPTPTATWTKTVVQDFVLAASVTTNVDCGITCAGGSPLCIPEPATDPRCASGTPIDPADPTTSGALSTGTWVVSAVDAKTLSAISACAFDATGALVCNLPARAAGSPAKDILVLLAHRENVELKPDPVGHVDEFTLAGNTFTGFDPATTGTVDRCTQLVSSTANEDGEVFHTCVKANRFTKLVALQHVSIAFGASNVSPATALPGGTLGAPPYITNGIVKGNPFTWDSGIDDLPGPLH